MNVVILVTAIILQNYKWGVTKIFYNDKMHSFSNRENESIYERNAENFFPHEIINEIINIIAIMN